MFLYGVIFVTCNRWNLWNKLHISYSLFLLGTKYMFNASTACLFISFSPPARVNVVKTSCPSHPRMATIQLALWRFLSAMFIATIRFSIRSFHFLLQRFPWHEQKIGETVEVPPFLFAYRVGQKVPARDDCNICKCNADGRVTCTDKSTLNICTRFRTLALTSMVKFKFYDHYKIN